MSEPNEMPLASPARLLHAKLMPPRLPSAVIPRRDLLARLDAGLTRRLILVVAPTGYGKTTLVTHWLAGRKIPSAWLTLDEYDNDPVRFWAYVVSALRTLDSSLGKSVLSVLAASQPVLFRPLMTALVNDLAQLDKDCVLVLEDYHTITSTEIHDTVSFLLQHLPASLHVILLSRQAPPLPLGILRARDELIELDTANLRFTLPETQAFLEATAGMDLTAGDVARLRERTDGWAAGLRLAALSLQNKSALETSEIIQSFSGGHRYVADYLIREVFQNQSEAVQNFMLKTCFLDRLTGSLCDAVTGGTDGAAMLEQLGRENLFIVQLEQGGERPWYRYNPLFAESIQYLARQQWSDSTIASILGRASGWYEAHGLYEEAIESALAAQSFERALALIERYIEIHELAELRTLGRWLDKTPEAELFLHPEICFTYAQIMLYIAPDRFAPATAARLEPFLSAAERAWRDQENNQRLGELLSFRGIVAWWQGDFPKAFQHAHDSLAELAEYDVFWRGNSLLIGSYQALNAGRIMDAQDQVLEARALLGAAQNVYGVLAALQILSDVFYWQGELEQVEQLNRQILAEAVGEESMLDDQGMASLGLANVAYERNDLVRAEPLAARALELARQRGNEMLEAQAVIRQAYIRAAQNDLSGGRELLKSLVAGIKNPVLLREIQATQAHLSILAGQSYTLTGWQSHISEADESQLSVLRERERFSLARLRIVEGQAREALEILQGEAADAAENGRVRSQVTALCLAALAYHADANPAEAAQALSEAIVIGRAKELRRLFLDEGARMAALLRAILPTLTDRAQNLYATVLLRSFDPGLVTQQDGLALVEPLSQQELRVLRLLAAGLSNGDIARELVISVNTVKTHVKSVYRKLDISSRDEARQVARELKLL